MLWLRGQQGKPCCDFNPAYPAQYNFPVIIQASMNMGSIVVTAASLSFLVWELEGYDWGQMISYARN